MKDKEEKRDYIDPRDEPGAIGDESCPSGIEKTDKSDWAGTADKAKKEPILPEKVRDFLNGL